METRADSQPILGRGVVASVVSALVAISISSPPTWLAFPPLYLTVTLIRGPSADWYLYPFLDPRESGGYPSVVAYSLAVLVVLVGVVAFLRWWSNGWGATSSTVAAPQPG